MQNKSVDKKRVWRDGDLEYTEVVRQEYGDCVFSAGFVSGHPVDTMYLKMERGGPVDVFLLLRPDEMAAMAWLANGALWAHEMRIFALLQGG